MSRHALCTALVVTTLTACVPTQDAHSPVAQALADLRARAEAGDATAQYNLGAMYDQGRGVPQDDAEAVAWYRRAAEQGDARAQYNLGGMYAEGLGVPQDAVEALMWLTIAAARSTGVEREHMVTARAGVARGAPGHEEPCRAAQRHGTQGLEDRARRRGCAWLTTGAVA